MLNRRSEVGRNSKHVVGDAYVVRTAKTLPNGQGGVHVRVGQVLEMSVKGIGTMAL